MGEAMRRVGQEIVNRARATRCSACAQSTLPGLSSPFGSSADLN
jgi:hypothetical protein